MNALYYFSVFCTLAIQILLIILMVFGIITLTKVIKLLQRTLEKKNTGDEEKSNDSEVTESEVKALEEKEVPILEVSEEPEAEAEETEE